MQDFPRIFPAGPVVGGLALWPGFRSSPVALLEACSFTSSSTKAARWDMSPKARKMLISYICRRRSPKHEARGKSRRKLVSDVPTEAQSPHRFCGTEIPMQGGEFNGTFVTSFYRCPFPRARVLCMVNACLGVPVPVLGQFPGPRWRVPNRCCCLSAFRATTD